MRRKLRRRVRFGRLLFAASLAATAVAAVAATATLLSTSSSAHFALNANVRIVHVLREEDGARVLMRLPMPYLIADKIGETKTDQTLPPPAPYSYNALEDGQVVHYVDADAVRRDPLGLGRIAVQGHRLIANGIPLRAETIRAAVQPTLTQTPFVSWREATKTLRQNHTLQSDPLYVGDAVVDVEAFYALPASGARKWNDISLSIRGLLNPNLPTQDRTANLILDHGTRKDLVERNPNEPQFVVHRARGILAEGVEISSVAARGLLTFLRSGAIHILEGLDHVLFVLCLTLGAATLSELLLRVTGFTLGHAATLAIGFFGYAPQGEWFVPLVETLIAASILYASAEALKRRREPRHVLSLAATIGFGLLHGLGFSFALRSMLPIDAPDAWMSLAAFNLGVEVGQIAIVLPVWFALILMRRFFPRREAVVVRCAVAPCIAVAAYWIGQRAYILLSIP